MASLSSYVHAQGGAGRIARRPAHARVHLFRAASGSNVAATRSIRAATSIRRLNSRTAPSAAPQSDGAGDPSPLHNGMMSTMCQFKFRHTRTVTTISGEILWWMTTHKARHCMQVWVKLRTPGSSCWTSIELTHASQRLEPPRSSVSAYERRSWCVTMHLHCAAGQTSQRPVRFRFELRDDISAVAAHGSLQPADSLTPLPSCAGRSQACISERGVGPRGSAVPADDGCIERRRAPRCAGATGLCYCPGC